MHLLLKARRILQIFRSLSLELKVIFITFAVLTSLPVLGFMVLSNTGLVAVAATLAVVNTVTHMVTIMSPNGDVVAHMQVSTVWPAWGTVTTEFGDRTPYQDNHTGTDVANKTGTAITPFMVGKVIKVENNPDNSRGFGKYVEIDHGSFVTSIYGHMSETRVAVGQTVNPGDLLGLLGSTGHSTGPHVHFEIRVYEIPVNPRTFMVGEPLNL